MVIMSDEWQIRLSETIRIDTEISTHRNDPAIRHFHCHDTILMEYKSDASILMCIVSSA